MKKHISFYDLAALEIQSDNPWLQDVLDSFGDVPDLAHSGESDKNDIVLPTIRMAYVPTLGSDRLRELDANIYVAPGKLLDRKYNVSITALETTGLQLETPTACLEWLIWGMQLMLLQSSASFIHAAGIEKDGQAVLFPSWGGVGKTAIVKAFVKDWGWNLLGDDLVIVMDSGVCYGFPKPMVLYPYHRDTFPDVFASGQGPVAPSGLNSLLTKIARGIKPILRLAPGVLQFARRHNPQSVRIRPSAVFGKDKLTAKAQLKSIVWIDRVMSISEPQFSPISKKDVVSRIIGSTLREQYPWCRDLTNIMCGLGIYAFDDIYPLWFDIISRALEATEHHILYLPEKMSLSQVPEVVRSTLSQTNIL